MDQPSFWAQYVRPVTVGVLVNSTKQFRKQKPIRTMRSLQKINSKYKIATLYFFSKHGIK